METKHAIASVLFSISAYAEREGLADLHRKVADAAATAMSEVPGADRDERLAALTGKTRRVA
jgi:hypothetical protein